MDMSLYDPNAPILECRDVCISYFTRAGEIPAVVDFNLVVEKGEAVGLVGESGCGKSTVALAIMQYMGKNGRIVSGQVKFMGRDMTEMSERELRDLRGSAISMVYQEPMASLNPAMRIGAQLVEVILTHEQGVSAEDAKRRALETMGDMRLPEPTRIFESYPHQISGGQQQRVVIAMALLANPKLMLLDEPTTALDVTVEAGIVELIKNMAARYDTSLIFISHNLGLILETCDKISVMYSGQAVETGKVGDVFDEMRHPYTRGLFSSIPLPGADKNARPLIPIRGQLPLPHQRPKGCYFGPRCDYFDQATCDDNGAVHMEDVDSMPGHRVRCARWRDIDWAAAKPRPVEVETTAPGEQVLDIRSMRKYYPLKSGSIFDWIRGKGTRYVKANEDISFEAREAETVAIVGESGCGKSTLAKVLLGLETATAGEANLRVTHPDGSREVREIAHRPVDRRRASTVSSLQIIFQNPFETLNPSHTVGSQIARVIRKFGVESDEDRIRERVFELLDIVKLPRDFYYRRPRQLSGGQKQRVGIARAFAGEPDLVVADEPVSALDVSVQAAVTGLLMEIQREKRTTMLFISHDLSVVRYLADRVVVMYLGHIVEQGSVDDVYAPPYHPYTEALLSAAPIADTSVTKKRIVLEGELPSAVNPPTGCPFQTRCHRKIAGVCDVEVPPLKDMGDGHKIMCHLGEDVFREMEPVIAMADPSAAE